ncbi:hypothetical protein LTR56_019543 [Elasticomyces elasticus]|nr:hypothetical protein LTR56_019543 [Elasticomyces elasticus]KAK3653753.1 hypothetical protein LTR22_011132 [Elasticomyces elasticus]
MPDDEVAEQNGYWEMVASHGFSAPQPAQPTQGMPAQPAYGDLTAQVADGVGVRSMHQVTAYSKGTDNTVPSNSLEYREQTGLDRSISRKHGAHVDNMLKTARSVPGEPLDTLSTSTYLFTILATAPNIPIPVATFLLVIKTFLLIWCCQA